MLELETLKRQCRGVVAKTLGEDASGRVLGVFLLVVLAAFCRLLPHPVNFSPLAAIALFSGYQLRGRGLAYAFAFFALLLTDCFLGFHNTMLFVYFGFGLSVAIGSWIEFRIGSGKREQKMDQQGRGQKLLHLVGGTALSSLLFFLVSNFGVWFVGELYPRTWNGLVECFTMALPFYQNTVAGDFIFVAVIFSVWALLEKRFSVFRAVEVA